MSQRFREPIKRINAMFEGKFEDPSMNMDTLAFIKSFLESRIEFPIRITGEEDFSWEEFYVLGPGDKKEYEILKKTMPSYTDIYSMTGIYKTYNVYHGLYAKAIRISDNKWFKLPLVDMKAFDKKSAEYLLLKDYSIWFVNY